MNNNFGAYELRSEIGHGKFGTVYIASLQSDPRAVFAAKKISKEQLEKSPKIKELFEAEVSIMRKINHPHILHLHDLVETPSSFYMVTEYCPDGDMEKYLHKKKRLCESEAVFYLKQIMSGFIELHMNKVMHRDLKPANIYLNSGHVVIGDFGLAKMDSATTTSKIGTPYFMAPEIQFTRECSPYTSKCDLFSIGVVYYYMLFGIFPFEGSDIDALEMEVEKYSGKNLRIPSDHPVSHDSQDLLKALLEVDPVNRISWNLFFNHNLFRVSSLNNYVFEYKESVQFANEKLEPRILTINSSVGSGSEKSLLVNFRFEQERKRVTEIGDIDMADREDQKEVVSEQLFESGKAKVNFKRFMDYFIHERNVRMFILGGAMYAKNLYKENSDSLIRDRMLLTSYLLSLKGMKMCTQLALSMLYRHNVLNIEDFDYLIESHPGQKLLVSLRKDEADSKKFFDRLREIVVIECKKKEVERLTYFNMDVNQELLIHDIDFLLKRIMLSHCEYVNDTNERMIISEEKKDKLVRLVGIIEYSLKPDQYFPFELDGKEFDWENLKQSDPLFINECNRITKEYSNDMKNQNQKCEKLCSNFCK